MKLTTVSPGLRYGSWHKLAQIICAKIWSPLKLQRYRNYGWMMPRWSTERVPFYVKVPLGNLAPCTWIWEVPLYLHHSFCMWKASWQDIVNDVLNAAFFYFWYDPISTVQVLSHIFIDVRFNTILDILVISHPSEPSLFCRMWVCYVLKCQPWACALTCATKVRLWAFSYIDVVLSYPCISHFFLNAVLV